MARVGRGDQAACALLVDRHLGPVLGFCRRLLGDPAEAEDAAQEVFLRLWAQAARWRPGEAKLRTWLFRVGHNLCIDKLRRRPTLPLEAAGDPVDSRTSVPDAMIENESRAWLRQAVASLPERQRAALELCHYQGMSNAEAGDVLGVGVEAVESLLARARRTLRQRLRAEAPELMADA